jgi:hypothetical protein
MQRKKSKPKKQKFIESVIANKFYGKALLGKKVSFEGYKELPKFVKKDGSFSLGKHLFENIGKKFKKFEFIITNKQKSKIEKKGGLALVYLSQKDWDKMQVFKRERTKDISHRVVNKVLGEILPKYFSEDDRLIFYEKGMLSEILRNDFSPINLSKDDVEALEKFIPRIVGLKLDKKQSPQSVLGIKNNLQLGYLEEVVKNLEKRVKTEKSENSWQEYLKENILLLQDGYIKRIDKLNIDLDPKYPDFALATYDSYLDILEIKTPFTQLLKYDDSHSNYYWSPDLAKAISQIEKYIDVVNKNSDRLRNYIRDKHGIDLNIIKPRGVIIVGSYNEFTKNRGPQNDFRLLSESLKNVTIITYDDLVTRLKNKVYILKESVKKLKRKKK